jgi:site-specific recombinase XerC
VARRDARAGPKPATLTIRYRSIHQFFRWAHEEGLIRAARPRTCPPRIPETPPDVLRDEDLARLLKVVDADKSFAHAGLDRPRGATAD